jgi:hypothetical protein
MNAHQTVIDLTGTYGNGVRRLAGTWTETEHEEFVAAIQGLEEIDQEFWK